MWITKASESEPLMKCRKRIDDIKTGVESLPRDEPGGSLLTGQVVSGMEVARAWSGLLCGTWEPVAPTVAAGQWRQDGPAAVRASENPKQLKLRGGEYRCGAQGRTVS